MSKHAKSSGSLAIILQNLPVDDRLALLLELHSVASAEHHYYVQWQSLAVSASLMNKSMNIIRKYEVNGLQLYGFGIWFFDSLLRSCKDPKIISETVPLAFVETILRMALEHKIPNKCFAILSLLTKAGNLQSKLFEIGLAISDQLPTPIKYPNFIDYFHYSLRSVAEDNLLGLPALKALSKIVSYVEIDHKANFFLQQYVPGVIALLDGIGSEALGSADSELLEATAKLFCGILRLHTSHPDILWKLGLTGKLWSCLKQHADNLSTEAAVQLLHYLTVCSASTAEIRKGIRKLVSITDVISTRHLSEPVLLERATQLYCVMYLDDMTAQGRYHNCKWAAISSHLSDERREMHEFALRAIVYKCQELLTPLHDTSTAPEESGQAKGPAAMFGAYAMTSVDMLAGSSSPPSSLSSISAGARAVRTLQQLGRRLSLHDVDFLQAPLSEIGRQAVGFLSSDQDILNSLHLVEALGASIGISMRCFVLPDWQMTAKTFKDSTDIGSSLIENLVAETIIDDDGVHVVSTSSKSEFSIARRGSVVGVPFAKPAVSAQASVEDEEEFLDNPCTVNSTLHVLSPRCKAFRNVLGEMCKEAFIVKCDEFTGEARLKADVFSDWEVQPTETVCRNLVMLYAIMLTCGAEAIVSIVEPPKLAEMLVEFINDARLGLDNHEGMTSICLKILLLLSIELGAEAIPPAEPLCMYCVNALTNCSEEIGSEADELFTCVSIMIALASHERTTRRQIIKNYGKISGVMSRIDDHLAALPMLQLLGCSLECASRIDDVGEECVITSAMMALRSSRLRSHMYVCKLIGDIGDCQLGLIHRCFGRREVEDILQYMLTTYKDPRDLIAIIRACTAMVRDINVKPWWLYTSWSYDWSVYDGGLCSRPLVQPEVAHTLQLIMTNGVVGVHSASLFAHALGMATALMYNCSDGSCTPSREADITNQRLLRNSLLKYILPLISRPLDLIIYRIPSSEETTASPGTAEGAQHSSSSSNSSVSSTSSPLPVSAPAVPAPVLSAKQKSPKKGAADQLTPEDEITMKSAQESSSYSMFKRTFSKRTKDPDWGTASRAALANLAPLPFVPNLTHIQATTNSTMELLAEKTVEALFAFFCLDEMFPMSTYLRNMELFQHIPVIASLSCTLGRFPDNAKIQKRGIDIYKCFAVNAVELPSLSMHAAPGLMMSMKICGSAVDHQTTVAKILIILASYDDFARENVLRFSVQDTLATLLQSDSLEAAVHACIAVTSLSQTKENAEELCSQESLIPSIVQLMDTHATDKRVQVEALKAVCALTKSEEIGAMLKPHAAALRKSRKFIHDLLKTDKLQPEYEPDSVEHLLATPVGKKDEKCSIS